MNTNQQIDDRPDFVREGFAKVQADFDYLRELFCQVIQETSEAKEIGEFIRQCFTDAPAPKNDLDNNPIRRCQALSIAFQLLNIVEENTTNQMRRRREGPQSESEPGLWLHDLHDLVARGFSEDAVRAAVDQASLEPVLTAHPTEAKRATVLEHHRALYLLLLERENRTFTAIEFAIFEHDQPQDVSEKCREMATATNRKATWRPSRPIHPANPPPVSYPINRRRSRRIAESPSPQNFLSID
jgi:phosphoenolpyruvate carboxylase